MLGEEVTAESQAHAADQHGHGDSQALGRPWNPGDCQIFRCQVDLLASVMISLLSCGDQVVLATDHHAVNHHYSFSGYRAIASSRSWLRATLDSVMKAGSSKGPTALTKSLVPMPDREPNRF